MESKQLADTAIPAPPSSDPEDDASYRDEKDMLRMGKLPELKRKFQSFSALGFTTAVMGTWEILYLQNTQALIDGGKAGMFWTYVWIYFGQTFVVLSLAEMSSIAPTAGGQYHWVSEFAPTSWQKILSYSSGWLSMLAWQLFVTANASLSANLILAMVEIQNPAFQIQPYMNTLLIIAVMTVMALYNAFGVSSFPKFEGGFAILHVACFVLVVAVLLSLAEWAPAAEVFLVDLTDNNEPGQTWPSIGLGLMVGQAPALFTVQGSDSVAHISEEVKDAGSVVPRAMITAYALNLPFAFGILITYLFTLGNTSEAIASPTGFPFIYALQNATPTAGATGVAFVMFLLIFMICTSITAAAARQTFAFARDGGTPCSKWVSRISRQWDSPINAVVVTWAFTVVMSLIYLGSAVAFNAFISLSVVALMATYSISISCVLIKRIRAMHGGPALPPSRFSLGRYAVVVNSVALAFCVYSAFWCLWPIANTAEVDKFNWAVVILAAVLLLATLTYFLAARRIYEGPVVQVRLLRDEAEER